MEEVFFMRSVCRLRRPCWRRWPRCLADTSQPAALAKNPADARAGAVRVQPDVARGAAVQPARAGGRGCDFFRRAVLAADARHRREPQLRGGFLLRLADARVFAADVPGMAGDATTGGGRTAGGSGSIHVSDEELAVAGCGISMLRGRGVADAEAASSAPSRWLCYCRSPAFRCCGVRTSTA